MSKQVMWNDVPVSFFSRDDTFNNNGKKVRTVWATVEDLEKVPEELFAIKISQSKKPELAGKPVFKYFVYKLKDTDAWSSLAPSDATPVTELKELKDKVVAQFANKPDARLAMSLKMHGSWGNIETSDGSYALYDDEHYPDTQGDPAYYLKSDTHVNIGITPAVSHGNEYLQISLSTDEAPDDIFQMKGRAAMHYWNEDNSDVAEGFDASQHQQASADSDNPWAQA